MFNLTIYIPFVYPDDRVCFLWVALMINMPLCDKLWLTMASTLSVG